MMTFEDVCRSVALAATAGKPGSGGELLLGILDWLLGA
jgi:hypothetical protein